MDALRKLLNYADPQVGEPYEPLTPTDARQVQPDTVSGCWQTWTGTHYPTLDSVPWQARGSAVLVPCDGTGAAHE